MKVVRILNKALLFAYFILKYQDFKLAFLFAHYQVSLQAASKVQRSGKYLVFSESRNKIPIRHAYIFKQELRALITVLNKKNTQVSTNRTTSGIELTIHGISVNVLSLSNIVTIQEIFLEKLYDLSTPNTNNVIIDIGMNVGYASLFFASSEKISHVYSFEPFPETYKEAITNIENNPHLKNKIKTYNYGASDNNKEVEVPMLESGSAIASTSKLFEEHNKIISNKRITVQVKSIITILNEVIAKHPNQRLFLKIDCEGEEYAIMDCLNGHEVLKKVSGFFIEWHLEGPDAIVSILNKNNFISLNLPREGVNSGMIYAFEQ